MQFNRKSAVNAVKRSWRPIVTTGVAVAAVATLGVGTATAAGMINGDNIRNQTVDQTEIGKAGVSGNHPSATGNSEIEGQSVGQGNIGFQGVSGSDGAGNSEIQHHSVGMKDLSGGVTDQLGKGEKGDQGPKGPKGEPGVAGLVIPTETMTVPAESGRSWYAVRCPEGKFAVSGGWRAHQGSGNVQVTADKPNWAGESTDPDRAVGWNVGAYNDGSEDGQVTVWAICANLN